MRVAIVWKEGDDPEYGEMKISPTGKRYFIPDHGDRKEVQPGWCKDAFRLYYQHDEWWVSMPIGEGETTYHDAEFQQIPKPKFKTWDELNFGEDASEDWCGCEFEQGEFRRWKRGHRFQHKTCSPPQNAWEWCPVERRWRGGKVGFTPNDPEERKRRGYDL